MALGNLHVELKLIADQYLSGMKNAQREATTLGNSFRPLTKTLADFGDGMKTVGLGLTASVTAPLVAIGAFAVKTGIDFESAFAGVRKTVNATEPELASLRTQFREMAKEIPVSAVELAKIGEAAGQLGIKTQDIAAFTKQMAMLGATTNLTSDQAATATANFQNIFGAAGKDVDRFASTLVALGNAGASTEKDIIDMGLRIAGAGTQVGLTQAQVLGFASALSSVGINAEAGGSAISRVFLKINDAVFSGGSKLQEFARIAGMSSAAFSHAFKTDASGATIAFIEGLARLKKSGENVNATLEGVVGKNIILKDTLNRAAGSAGELRRQVTLGTQAWLENKAAQEEFDKRVKTTESQLKLLKAQFVDIGITLFDALGPVLRETVIPAFRTLADAIAEIANRFVKLPPPIQTATIAILALAAATGPALTGIGFMVTQVSALIPVGVRLASMLSGGAGLTAGLKGVAAASTTAGAQAAVAAGGIKGVAAASATAGANTAAAAGGAATLAGSLSKVGIAGVAAKVGVLGLAAAGATVSTAFLKAQVDFVGYESSLKRAHDSAVRLRTALLNIDFKTWGGEIKSALSDMTGGLEKFTPAWLKLILNMPNQIREAKNALADFMPEWLRFLNNENGPSKGPSWNEIVDQATGINQINQAAAALEMLGKNPGVPGGLKVPGVVGVGEAGSKFQGPVDPLAGMDPAALKAFRQWPEARAELYRQIKIMEGPPPPPPGEDEASKSAKKAKEEFERFQQSVADIKHTLLGTTPPSNALVTSILQMHYAGEMTSDAIRNLAKDIDTLKNSTHPVIQQYVRMIPLMELHAKTAELEAGQIQAVAEATKDWADKSENLDFSFLPKPDLTMPNFKPLEPEDFLRHEAVTRVGELNDQLKALKATVPAVERQVRLLRIEGKSDAEIMALLGGEMESAARIAKQFNVPLGELTRTIIYQQDRVNNLRHAWSETFASISDRLVDMVVDFDFSFKKLSDFAKDTAKSLARSFLDGFFKPFRDGLAGLGESLAGALSGLLTKGSGGGGIGGILGGLLGGGKGGLLGKIPGVGGILAGGVAGASMLAPEIAGLAAIAGSVGPGSAAATAAGLGGGAAAGGGGLMAAIGGLATNPITIAAAGALGVGLLIKKFTGQGRETADIFGEAVQKPFGTTGDQYFEGLQDIIDPITKAREAGTLTAKMVLDAQAALEKDWKTFGEISQSFIDAEAGVGGKEQLVVDQAFETLNPIIEDIRASLQADLARLSGNQALVNGSAGTGGVTVNNPTINVYAPTGDGQDIAQQIWNIMHNNWAGTAEETARRVFALEPAVVSR